MTAPSRPPGESGGAPVIGQIRDARRILVLGPPGSGKTRLSLRLARARGLEVIHLDRLFWKPGWIRTPEEEWRRVVAALVTRESWIMDGTYEASLDLRLPPADGVIYLERSPMSCLLHVAWRRLRDRDRQDAPPGQKLDRAFLRYIWRFPKVTRPEVMRRIRQFGKVDRLVLLSSRREVRSLLLGLC